MPSQAGDELQNQLDSDDLVGATAESDTLASEAISDLAENPSESQDNTEIVADEEFTFLSKKNKKDKKKKRKSQIQDEPVTPADSSTSSPLLGKENDLAQEPLPFEPENTASPQESAVDSQVVSEADTLPDAGISEPETFSTKKSKKDKKKRKGKSQDDEWETQAEKPEESQEVIDSQPQAHQDPLISESFSAEPESLPESSIPEKPAEDEQTLETLVSKKSKKDKKKKKSSSFDWDVAPEPAEPAEPSSFDRHSSQTTEDEINEIQADRELEKDITTSQADEELAEIVPAKKSKKDKRKKRASLAWDDPEPVVDPRPHETVEAPEPDAESAKSTLDTTLQSLESSQLFHQEGSSQEISSPDPAKEDGSPEESTSDLPAILNDNIMTTSSDPTSQPTGLTEVTRLRHARFRPP